MKRTKEVMNEVGLQDIVAARTKAAGVASSVTNCEAIAKHPQGNAAATMPCKFIKGILLLLRWFGASACRQSRSETLLPCSVGRADVRITDAWIYSEAE